MAFRYLVTHTLALHSRLLPLVVSFAVTVLIISSPGLSSQIHWNWGNYALVRFFFHENWRESRRYLEITSNHYVQAAAQKSDVYVGRKQQVSNLINRYETDPFVGELQAETLFDEAVKFRKEGKLQLAIDRYKSVIASQTNLSIPATYQLWRIYQSLGDSENALRVLDNLRHSSPKVILSTANTIESWTLVGYTLNKFSFETRRLVPSVLYWQANEDICPSNEVVFRHNHGKDFYCTGQFVYEVSTLANRAWFGEDIYLFARPALLGFQEAGFNAQGSNIAFSINKSLESSSYKIKSFENSNAILISQTLPVEPANHYILGSRIQTTPGMNNASYGVICFGNSYSDNQRYFYVAREIISPEWTFYAGLIDMPNTSMNCRALLLNYGAPAEVYFDDILFAQVSSPTLSIFQTLN